MSENSSINFTKEYRKTIVNSIASSFLVGFPVALWTATYKLSRIKSGEYPGMPKVEIEQQYNEILPSVITESILMCIGITIVVAIPNLYLRFKYLHSINVFSELSSYMKRRGE